MKPLFFKSILLFLASTTILFAQEKIIFKNSFETKGVSVIDLTLRKIPVLILPSLDDKIHIKLAVKYKNFSKKAIEKILPKVVVKKQVDKKILSLKIESEKTIPNLYYASKIELKVDNSKLFKTNKKEQKFKRKTKQEIIHEIITGPLKEESILGIIFKTKDGDIEAKSYRPKFVLYIPEHLTFKINAYRSSIKLEHENVKKLTLKMNKGGFTARKLTDATISMMNAPLRVEEIEKGNISLKNGLTSLIGSVYRTTLKTDASFLKIGTIREKVRITDFNSEIFLYNFSQKFDAFNFKGEYSKIHLYELKSNYSLKAVGNNTVNKFENHSISMQPSKTGKKFKMMERKRNQQGNYAGHIGLDITHGIIYSHNETFTKTKTP